MNSLISGPSSLESARIAKAVIPTPAASNQQITSSLVTHVIGRGVATDTIITAAPTLDPATGRFSGPAQPADGGIIGFVGEFAAAIIQPSQSGALTMRLDSLHMGQFDASAGFGVVSAVSVATEYYVTLGNGVDSSKLLVPLTQALNAGGAFTGTEEQNAFFEALVVDQPTANRFEGAGDFRLQGQATVRSGPGHELGGWGVGCRFGDFGDGDGLDCFRNGSRWFDGPSPTTNETVDDPNGGNCFPASFTGGLGSGTAHNPAECNLTNYNNAGALTGVTTIQQILPYIQLNGSWRNMDWVLPTVRRAADFNVYWGDGGVVDSVVDITHNVVVPFLPYMGGGWGILNTASGANGSGDATNSPSLARPTVLTALDLGCVEPWASGPTADPRTRLDCAAPAAFSSTAQLGSVAFFKTSFAEAAAIPPAAEGGFLFYIAGDVFMMAMPALPASGTVWALRSYVGTITGTPGSLTFNAPEVRPFTAIGATSALEFGVLSSVAAATKNDLSRVHTVPDPYYVKSAYEASTEQKILKFVGLPQRAIIRIYSVSGVLVRMLEHDGARYNSTSRSQGSEFDWDLRNRNNQVVASGVYFYHVEAGDARRVGRFTVVNFAQ